MKGNERKAGTREKVKRSSFFFPFPLTHPYIYHLSHSRFPLLSVFTLPPLLSLPDRVPQAVTLNERLPNSIKHCKRRLSALKFSGNVTRKKRRRKKNVISLNWIGKFENELLPAFFSLLFFLWRDRRRMKPNQTNKYGRHLKRKILLFFLNSFWNAFMIFFHVKFENWWA